MGWLWASRSPASHSAPAQPQPPSKPDPAQSPSPNEPVDPELQRFLGLLKADTDDASAVTPSSTRQSSSSPWLSPEAAPRTATPPREALAESILPTEMSCRQAFDLAFYCGTLGGQFINLYRYGSSRSCSDLWDEFWFCMRTRSHAGEVKKNMIRQYYRDKERAKYGPGKPSSEDIWESRPYKLPPGTAFSQEVEELDLDDNEWRRRERQRRAEIRQRLGFEQPTS